MLFYDIELAEKPNWKNLGAAKMAVGVTYCDGQFELFYSKEEMAKAIQNPMVTPAGFNSHSFDDKVLGAKINGFDIYADLVRKTGIPYVTSLDSLCKTTLGEGKEGISGKEVPALWQAGEREKVIEYCKRDCKMLADVFDFGVKYGYVLIPPNKNQEVFGGMVLKINTEDWRNCDGRISKGD